MQPPKSIDFWLPPEESDSSRYFTECRLLYYAAKALAVKLESILAANRTSHDMDFGHLELDCTSTLQTLIGGITKLNTYKTDSSSILSHRRNSWRQRIWMERLVISRLLHEIINRFIHTNMVEITMRLAHLYNETLSLSCTIYGLNLYSNTCPMTLHPLKKLTVPRLLQILAQKRAEPSSYLLLDGLLASYYPPGAEKPPDTPETRSEKTSPPPPPTVAQTTLAKQDSVSSDTSVEIFRALTQHLDTQKKPAIEEMTCLQLLLKIEEQRVVAFLGTIARAAPQLLVAHCVKPSTTTGETKLKGSVKKKLVSYFQDVLWGEVGAYLEHVLLWWGPDPLGTCSPSSAQHLRDYLVSLRSTDYIPEELVAATNSLTESLVCHITSTSWDQLFRSSLVAAANLAGFKNYGFSQEGTETGLLFVALLADLVKLNNTCEKQWVPLDQLPLVEQIPILHRLDHSVHTVRLWAASKCRQLATTWNVAHFYCIAQADITKCIDALNALQLANHGTVPPVPVHVAVCAKMRGKLVSEVKTNIDKLRGTLAECVEVLASGCRTQCLAHLHMTCPPANYWRQSGPLPDCASEYVENYLDYLLRPVLAATDKLPLAVQQSSAAMVLRILCESWLEYIYLHRIKFSEWGAVQLLTDFGAVPTWMMERVQLPKELLNPLMSHEVLRRCEGVGRLLLRRRGESITMTSSMGHRTSGKDEKSADTMPAEMYVTNQEQWLELRAPRTANICCQL